MLIHVDPQHMSGPHPIIATHDIQRHSSTAPQSSLAHRVESCWFRFHLESGWLVASMVDASSDVKGDGNRDG